LQQSWEGYQQSVNIYSRFQDVYPRMRNTQLMMNYLYINESMYMYNHPYINEQRHINQQLQRIREQQKNNAGRLLGLDLSEVSTDIYAKACSIAIVAIEERDSRDDNLNLEHTLMMEDILLRGGESKNITPETRKSDQYKNLLEDLREVLPSAIREAQGQQNQDREPQ
jgi:hypothetical protein